MTNPTDIDALVALGEEITPGEWKATTNAYGCNFVQRWEAGEAHGLICGGNSHDILNQSNARAIAAVPRMIAALTALRNERDALREAAGPFTADTCQLWDDGDPEGAAVFAANGEPFCLIDGATIVGGDPMPRAKEIARCLNEAASREAAKPMGDA